MFINRRKHEQEEINRSIRTVSFPRQELSQTVDLRPWMTPVEQQGDMLTCSANAFAGVCEYLLKRYSNRTMDISRLFIYYNGQTISQQTNTVQDVGVEQKNIALGLRKYGVCQEYVWPYKPHLINVKPSTEAYRKASHYTVLPLRIPRHIKAIEACLHNQIPVLIDIILPYRAGTLIRANRGYLPLSYLKNSIIDPRDLHTVLLVGYNRDTKHFIARNSWGKDWGSRGYFYMPYDYLSDRRLVNPYDDGLWTITQIIPRTNRLPDIYQVVLPNHQKNHHHRLH